MMPPMQAFGFLLFRDMIVSGSFIEVPWYASAYRYVVRRALGQKLAGDVPCYP
jgi:hypothetical protein